ncbi:Uncharacterised protein [Burkholderia pseudomallei]|nr:DUF5677 domain-containing protein [Burkholderia pseudomallei]CPH47414.1 Uncharacterised protein [Burkholderia pseudomallei]CPH76273.1 Uncharacterised protein [Burkholderia pseudomallei]
MDHQTQTLHELRALIEEQQELLRLVLYVMSQGPIDYKGERLTSVLEWDKARATVAVSMGAGQSLNTILKLSGEPGIGVRDLYPIARSVVEGFINAAFFVTQPVEVAQRALRHIQFAAWKHHNRVIGSGEFMMTVSGDPDPKGTLEKQFSEFAGRGQGSWTNLDAPARISRVGDVVRAAGGALLGAYAAIYSVSSEIIHGSVYGMSYFFSAHLREQSKEAFLAATNEHIIDIYSAVSHAASGFLAAFANIHKFGPLVLDEHELFKRLYRSATGVDWNGGD